MMNDETKAAIAELRAAFPGKEVEVDELLDGGADVKVHGLDLGDKHSQSGDWIGFRIPAGYPFADVYPHYAPWDLKRGNGQQVSGSGLSGPVNWNLGQSLQISRKTSGWNPAVDSATTKLYQVVEWVRNQ